MLPDPNVLIPAMLDSDGFKAFATLTASASILAALTPMKEDNLILKWVKLVLDFLAFNWGNAKNEKKK